MKAARYYGPGDIRVEDVPEPPAEGSNIKIKIAWCGICGTDLHCYLAPFPLTPTFTAPNIVSGEILPITLGHEFSGTIVELGPDATKFSIGQNVVVEPVFSCMKPTCPACCAGTRNLCPLTSSIGIGGFGGGLAEFISVDQAQVHGLPPGIPLEVGACIEPLAVAWYAVKRSNFAPGNKVLVLGAGPAGLCILKVLRALDPNGQVIVSEPAQIRREFAAKHGADSVHGEKDDLMASVFAATNGAGVDIAFDAAGAKASVDTALSALRARGQLVVVSSWKTSPAVNLNTVLVKEINIIGTAAYTGIHPELLQAVSEGLFPGIEDIVTSKVALKDVVQKGILALLNQKDSEIKILVYP